MLTAYEQRFQRLQRPMPEGERRRREIYEYILAYADEKDGPTPSINEIHAAMAWSKNYSTAYYHVMKLIARGLLEQADGKLVVVGSEWIPPMR